MKLKKWGAVVLAAALALGLMSGCIGNFYENALSVDGTEISSGLYLMAQFNAYSEARGKVEDPEKVLKEKIEGKSATDWIRSRAEELCRRYVAVHRLAREKKVSLSSDSQSALEQNMQWWEYMAEMYTENGISQSTVQRYNANDALRNDLFLSLYGEGGELAPDDAELKKEYTEQFAHIRFFSTPTHKQDEASTDMTAELEPMVAAMVAQLNSGKTLEEVADSEGAKMAELLERDADSAVNAESITTSYIDLYPDNFDTYSEDFLAALDGQAEGDYGSYNMGSTIIVYEKIPMFADEDEFENARNTILNSVKMDEFDAYLEGIYSEYPVDWVFGAKGYLSPRKIKY